FMAQSFARGESAAWAPFVFSGHAQIADPQSLLFSPPFVALAAVTSNPGSWAADVTLFLTVLAGMLAIAVWFRDQGWHWAGAVLSAIAFGFGSSMAWRIQHVGQVASLVLLAIVLLFLSRALQRSSWAYGLAAGTSAAFLVLGRDQVALLSVYFLLAYVIAHWLGLTATAHERFNKAQRFHRSLLPLFFGGVAGVALIAIPVLMTLFAAESSNRPEIDVIGAGKGSLHPALFITAFAPDVFGSSGRMEDYWGPPSFAWPDTGLFIAQNMGQLYMGAIPALLLLAGIFSGVLWRREIRFFLLSWLAMIIYALGWYTPVFGWMHRWLPGVDFYRRPADATFLIGFLGAVLAGYVAHRLFSEPQWKLRWRETIFTAIIVAAAFLAAALLAFQFGRLSMAIAPWTIAVALVTCGAIVLVVARRLSHSQPLLAVLMVIGFTVGDLAWSNGPGGATALPPQHYSVLEPSLPDETIAFLKDKLNETRSGTRRDRVEMIGLGFHWPNAALTHRLESTLGYNPVRSALYVGAVGAGDTAGSPADRKFTPLFPSYRSPLANLLGLRFIAAGAPIETIDKSLPPGSFKLIGQTDKAWIYENPDALPRVLYAPQAKHADFDSLIKNGGMDFDFTQVVLIEDEATQKTEDKRPGKVRIVSMTNTKIQIEADGPDGGYVVLNDIWHPWWRASVDDVPAPILRANVLFRAVRVPPGRHVVRFSFRPVSGALRSLDERLGLGGT
ncbi:MAG: hypothetical protein ACK5KM_07285, partial [Hyphomicrobiaceae bacterium]